MSLTLINSRLMSILFKAPLSSLVIARFSVVSYERPKFLVAIPTSFSLIVFVVEICFVVSSMIAFHPVRKLFRIVCLVVCAL